MKNYENLSLEELLAIIRNGNEDEIAEAEAILKKRERNMTEGTLRGAAVAIISRNFSHGIGEKIKKENEEKRIEVYATRVFQMILEGELSQKFPEMEVVMVDFFYEEREKGLYDGLDIALNIETEKPIIIYGPNEISLMRKTRDFVDFEQRSGCGYIKLPYRLPELEKLYLKLKKELSG